MIQLELRTRFGKLKSRLDVPAQPMRLAELAWNAMALDEKLIGRGVQLDVASGERSVSCAKGCGACCRQIVPLSPPEAWMIADVVLAMPVEARAAVLERFAAVHTALDASPLAGRELTEKDGADGFAEAAAQFFELGVACPFLVDESCSIHPQRPSVCREYLVTSPASNCVQLRSKDVRRIPIAMRLSEALSRLTARLLERPLEIVPLHGALDWALENAEAGKRTWPSQMLVEKLLEEVQACQLGLEPTGSP